MTIIEFSSCNYNYKQCQTHAWVTIKHTTEVITGSFCISCHFHSLYVPSSVTCHYINRNVHFISLYIIRLPLLSTSHFLIIQLNEASFSLEHWEKTGVICKKNLSAFYRLRSTKLYLAWVIITWLHGEVEYLEVWWLGPRGWWWTANHVFVDLR